MTFQLDDAGRKFIHGWEGYRAEAYLDQGGVATIGWGHTGKYYPLPSCRNL
jgi:GH24 family phage-related lysozyme (muramidase)